MSHIFISYARKDLELAKPIVAVLAKDNLDIWIDWEDIPKGEEFIREIYKGIEGADAFLFLVSPDSAQSEWCNKEIAHAAKNNKRILPIVLRDTDLNLIHSEISKRNWIFCREGQDEFATAIEEIRETIHADYEWLKYHTKLQVKALDWEQTKDNSRLLRGKELQDAEQQFAKVNSSTEPSPTKLQKLYLTTSKEHEKKVKKQIIAISIVALLAIAVSLAWPFLSRERPIPGQWISIPAGGFTMGMDQKEADFSYAICTSRAKDKTQCLLPDELLTWSGRQIDTSLEDYKILDNEVTNAQYQQCVNAGNCKKPEDWSYVQGNINQPAANLNWFQANAYCEWMGGRLPTEGEWEKAARGPRNYYFPWGNMWDSTKANLEHYETGTVQSITKYAVTDISDYGVKNLAGNVQEWTISEYAYHALNQKFENKTAEITDDGQSYPIIVRGGSWINVGSTGMASDREVEGVLIRREVIGFRCVCPGNKLCKEPWDLKWIWFGN
jgi:formylglycine-generating enzyme required for sulfatase activity